MKQRAKRPRRGGRFTGSGSRDWRQYRACYTVRETNYVLGRIGLTAVNEWLRPGRRIEDGQLVEIRVGRRRLVAAWSVERYLVSAA